MYNLTLEDKRREMLRRQLFGKEAAAKAEKFQDKNVEFNNPSSETAVTNSYLKKDLTRIALFSSLAIAAQLILSWSLNNRLINLKFF